MEGRLPARYRISFAKGPTLRFISHLDLHRTWERTLRRAGLPLAYSRGFNPRPRINIGMALPLGCTSEGDLMDIHLMQVWESERLRAALRKAAPPGLGVEAVRQLAPADPALQRTLVSAEYRVMLSVGDDPVELHSKVAAVLSASELPRERRGKAYDLRPLIERLELEPADGERPPALHMQLAAREGATGRPEEVLRALGLDPRRYTPHRCRLIQRQDGEGSTDAAGE